MEVHSAEEPRRALVNEFNALAEQLCRVLVTGASACEDIEAACTSAWDSAFAWLKQRIQFDNQVIGTLRQRVKQCMAHRRAPHHAELLPPSVDDLGHLNGYGVWFGPETAEVRPEAATGSRLAVTEWQPRSGAALPGLLHDSLTAVANVCGKEAAVFNVSASVIPTPRPPMEEGGSGEGSQEEAAEEMKSEGQGGGVPSSEDWVIGTLSRAAPAAAVAPPHPLVPPAHALLSLSSSLLHIADSRATPELSKQARFLETLTLADSLHAMAASGDFGPSFQVVSAEAWQALASACGVGLSDARRAVLSLFRCYFVRPPSPEQLLFSAVSCFRVAKAFSKRKTTSPAALSPKPMLSHDAWQHVTLWFEVASPDAQAWLSYVQTKDNPTPSTFATNDTGPAGLNYVENDDERRRCAALTANSAFQDVAASMGDWDIHLESLREALWRGWSVPHKVPSPPSTHRRTRSKRSHPPKDTVVPLVAVEDLLLDLASMVPASHDPTGWDTSALVALAAAAGPSASTAAVSAVCGGSLLRAWLVLAVLEAEEQLGPKDAVEEWSSMAEWQSRLATLSNDPLGVRLPGDAVKTLLRHWETPSTEGHGAVSNVFAEAVEAEGGGGEVRLSYSQFAALCGVGSAEGIPEPLNSQSVRDGLAWWCQVCKPGVLPDVQQLLLQC